MEKQEKFFLHGLYDTANYGCEAIVRGTEMILKNICPEATITLSSWNPSYDKTRLEGADLKIINARRYPRYSPISAYNKIVRGFRDEWTILNEPINIIGNDDVVLSIGGDRYTLGFSDAFPENLIRFGCRAITKTRKFIIWGASIGPFSKNKIQENTIRDFLHSVHLITCREPITVSYLRSIGVEGNVVTCADPAFMISEPFSIHQDVNQSPRIAINLSPLSALYLGYDTQSMIRVQASTIATIMRRFNARIALIPHVFYPGSSWNDDHGYLSRILSLLPRELRTDVEFYDSDLGFLETRKLLLNCDLVIAARMHCAINAMTAQVPTMLLSYSQKAQGMGEYVYGHSDWVVDVQSFANEDTIDKVGIMLETKIEIQRYLMEKMLLIRHDALKAGFALKATLDNT